MTSLGICCQACLFSFKLCWENNEVFFFLCYSFFQAAAGLRNGNSIAFLCKPYDGRSIRIRRNFLSEQKELCECCGQIFLSSPRWDLSSPLLPSTLRMSAKLLPELPKMCYHTQRKRISLKCCLCNFSCGYRHKCVGGGEVFVRLMEKGVLKDLKMPLSK